MPLNQAPQVRRREGLYAAWEGLILLLVCANLALILFDSLQDVALRLLEGLIEGLQSEQCQALAWRLADQAFEAWLEQEPDADLALEELLVDILEVLKQQRVDRRYSRFVGPPVPATPA